MKSLIRTQIDIKKTVLIIVIYLSGIILTRITSQSPPPEETKNLIYAIPAFLIFIIFIISILGWGRLVLKTLFIHSGLPSSNASNELILHLAGGSVFFYLLAHALTAIGIFSVQFAPALWSFISLGVGWACIDIKLEKEKLATATYSLMFLLILIRLIEGLQFNQHGDAFAVYLPVPRIWAETGSLSDLKNHVIYFLSTSFESLYAWGNVLMGLQLGHGLDLSQWFAQWCVAGVGYGGTMFAVVSIVKKLNLADAIPKYAIPLIAILVVQQPGLQWTANMAKNDFGVIFWSLSSLYVLFFVPATTGLSAFSGVLLGAALVGKMTLISFVFPIAVYVLFFNVRHIPFFALGGVIGVAPILIRNYVLTSNPMFPWLTGFFVESQYLFTPTFKAGFAAASKNAFSFNLFPSYLNELLRHVFFFPAMFSLFTIKSNYKLVALTFLTIVSTLVFMFFIRPSTEIRYAGPILILLQTLGIAGGFFIIFELCKKLKINRKPIIGLYCIVLIAAANLPLFTLLQIGSNKFIPIVKRLALMNDVAGPAKAWIRANVKNETILSVCDGHNFYTMDLKVTISQDSQELETLLVNHTVEELSRILPLLEYDYLYLSTEANMTVYHSKIIELMKVFEARYGKCLRFKSIGGQVYQSKCIRGL